MPADLTFDTVAAIDRLMRFLAIEGVTGKEKAIAADVARALREVGVPAGSRIVPVEPVFPSMDELARAAGTHDLRPIGPPLSAEDTDRLLATAR